jgi:adenylate cyclase
VLAAQGDGFVSLWIPRGSTSDAATRLSACQAALDMTTAASRFNEARPEGERLPLRLGLTMGAVTIRSDADRGAFEAVGDAVNVAARLQQAGREVGAAVLASGELVEDLTDHVRLRRIDLPLALSGVTHAPSVFELRADDLRATSSPT